MIFYKPFLQTFGNRKKRVRMSKLSQIKALCLDLGYPKAKAVVLITEHAPKAKNHFSLCCRTRNTSYFFALPPWEILIFRFGGSANFLSGFFAQYEEKAQVHTRYLRAFWRSSVGKNQQKTYSDISTSALVRREAKFAYSKKAKKQRKRSQKRPFSTYSLKFLSLWPVFLVINSFITAFLRSGLFLHSLQ